MLDLFCGRFGWGRAFAARGWGVVGVDLVEPPEIPQGCKFVKMDVMMLHSHQGSMLQMIEARIAHRKLQAISGGVICSYNPHYYNELLNPEVEPFDFICASSPCEQFSVHGMKHFHPNPPYPTLGIKLFNHTRELCEASGVPYVMENVRAAQQFVGNAAHHCGPFYLWGTGVPPILIQGVKKAQDYKAKYPLTPEMIRRGLKSEMFHIRSSMTHKERAGIMATIPPELSNCVADYAERLLELTHMGKPELLGSGPIPRY